MATKWEGGACEGLPHKMGGSQNVLAMLKGGKNSFGVVFTQYHEVLTILKVGAPKVSAL